MVVGYGEGGFQVGLLYIIEGDGVFVEEQHFLGYLYLGY